MNILEEEKAVISTLEDALLFLCSGEEETGTPLLTWSETCAPQLSRVLLAEDEVTICDTEEYPLDPEVANVLMSEGYVEQKHQGHLYGYVISEKGLRFFSP